MCWMGSRRSTADTRESGGASSSEATASHLRSPRRERSHPPARGAAAALHLGMGQHRRIPPILHLVRGDRSRPRDRARRPGMGTLPTRRANQRRTPDMRTAAPGRPPLSAHGSRPACPKKRTDHREPTAGQIDENQNKCPRQPNEPGQQEREPTNVVGSHRE